MVSILADAYSITPKTLPEVAVIAALHKKSLYKTTGWDDISGNSLPMAFSSALAQAWTTKMEWHRTVVTKLRPPGFASLVPVTRR